MHMHMRSKKFSQARDCLASCQERQACLQKGLGFFQHKKTDTAFHLTRGLSSSYDEISNHYSSEVTVKLVTGNADQVGD